MAYRYLRSPNLRCCLVLLTFPKILQPEWPPLLYRPGKNRRNLMQPQHLIFGGGASATMLSPLVAVWMLIAIALILTLSRGKAIVPFLLAFFTIPFGQVILIGPLHFPVLRILILVAMVRRTISVGSDPDGRYPGGFNGIDRITILWIVSAFVVVSLQWMELQPIIKFVGDLMDSIFGYLVARFLIPNRDSVRRTLATLALVCLILGVCMVSEQFTHHNVFAEFGANEPTLRDGHIRAEGALGTLFGGAFAGVLIPTFLWLRKQDGCGRAAASGLIGATAMVVSSHASTSWLAYASGLLGLSFWPLRRQMRLVRWGIVVTLVGLHLVMHGPVWSLIEKIDITGGSSSYHRYMLVDNCIRHFSDWWLLGYKFYGSWGFDMWDLCNQFVAVALTGGLVTLVLFIMIYSRSLGMIGKTRKRIRGNSSDEWLLWCLGSTLFANIVVSFGINYMIQLQMLLFTLLACVSVATARVPVTVKAKPVGDGIARTVPASVPVFTAFRGSK